MAFYDKFAGKLQQTGQDAIDKTKKTAESVKLKSAISDLEKEIQSVYTDIGKAYFSKYAADIPDEELIPYFQKIKNSLDQIENYQEQIRSLKGMVKCKKCGGDINADATFCRHCGARLISEVIIPTEGRVCSNCGQFLEEDALFCPGCGQSVGMSKEEKRHCINCGKELEPDMLFCVYCGQKNEISEETADDPGEESGAEENEIPEQNDEQAPIFCVNCGAELKPDEKFCFQCGQRIEEP